jgi:hypothetical protein
MQLNSGVFTDSIGTKKIITVYLAIVLNYHYTINLDKVVTD